MKFYAGIGARKTPNDILELMTKIAGKLEERGYILRSGGANGADLAFEKGVKNPENKRIYLPWNGFNGKYKSSAGIVVPALDIYDLDDIVDKYHPAPNKLSSGARRLMKRSVLQVLGNYIDKDEERLIIKNKSRFVICWTPNGQIIGGTGFTIRVAKAYNVPVFNLAIDEIKYKLIEKLNI